MKQHKWHKEIKAWADGAEIEMWYGDRWEQVHHIPEWNMEAEFRIKPQPQKTDKELAEEIIKIPKVKAMVDKLIDRFTEPQYLYVSYHPQNSSIRLLDYEDKNSYYIGKIKLEDTK